MAEKLLSMFVHVWSNCSLSVRTILLSREQEILKTASDTEWSASYARYI